MWPVASTTEALTTAFSNIGTIFALAIAAILVAWASLTGLGFAKRKVARYVTGKKF